MNKSKILVLVILLFVNLSAGFAQQKKKASSSSNNNDLGIGIRLGDPTAFTLKKYFKGNALEVNIGRGHVFYGSKWHDRYHKDWYEDWYREAINYSEFQYIDYKRSFPLAIQVHYLFHKDFGDIANLQWYWGIGGQFRHQRYTYLYKFKYDNSNFWHYGEDRISDIDFGVDGVIGVEYRLRKVPVTFFGDLTLFTEIVDDPFRFWLQSGIGARYNF